MNPAIEMELDVQRHLYGSEWSFFETNRKIQET
jgi:hypothetical protein